MVLYTIAGSIVGFIGSYVIGSIMIVDDRSTRILPSPMFFFVAAGTVVGAAVGFGVGASKLLDRHYFG